MGMLRRARADGVFWVLFSSNTIGGKEEGRGGGVWCTFFSYLVLRDGWWVARSTCRGEEEKNSD